MLITNLYHIIIPLTAAHSIHILTAFSFSSLFCTGVDLHRRRRKQLEARKPKPKLKTKIRLEGKSIRQHERARLREKHFQFSNRSLSIRCFSRLLEPKPTIAISSNYNNFDRRKCANVSTFNKRLGRNSFRQVSEKKRRERKGSVVPIKPFDTSISWKWDFISTARQKDDDGETKRQTKLMKSSGFIFLFYFHRSSFSRSYRALI